MTPDPHDHPAGQTFRHATPADLTALLQERQARQVDTLVPVAALRALEVAAAL